MDRRRAIIGTVIFFFVAPGVIVGFIPWGFTRWQLPDGAAPFVIAGGAIVLAGLAASIACFARFALEGHGTPAPIAPTHTLITTGLYRHVRNPMYVAVLTMLIGQTVMFLSLPVLAYAVAIWLITHMFVLGYEEPTLRITFPDEYAEYVANVPRWIPRLTPWKPPVAQSPAPPPG